MENREQIKKGLKGGLAGLIAAVMVWAAVSMGKMAKIKYCGYRWVRWYAMLTAEKSWLI